MIWRKIKSFVLPVGWRKTIFGAPVAGNLCDVRIGRIPVAHVNFETRLVKNAVLPAFQPVIPPARGLHAPFNAWSGLSIVWKTVIPGAEQGFYLRVLCAFEESADAVAIAVEKTADHESRHFLCSILIARDRSALPKCSVALVMKIEKKPGSGVETRRKRFFIGGKIRRARDADLHIHAELEFIDVHEAINVMNIVVEKIFGSAHRDDRFQRGGMQVRQLNGVEAAPGNSHHPDVAVGPRLFGKPVDHF